MSYPTAFFATWRTVIFAPRAFFGGLSPGGTLVKPLVFAVICSAIGFAGVLLWLVVTAFSYVGPSRAALFAARTLAAAPVAYVFAFVVTVAFLHVLARGLGGGGDIRATMRATAYCQAAAVAEVIPPIGTIVAFVLRLSLYGWGVSAVHGFSVKKAIVFYVIILVTAAGFVYFGVQLLTPFLPAVV
jgi:hypothetical protein